jgi:asparagine synthase (glutamine-hydrolysing)
MCGIVGFVDLYREKSNDDLRSIVVGMANAIQHRGPDGEGFWVAQEFGVALGHRRLAVVDLTEGGRQPMELVAKGRWVITFNGEIYNYLELREELRSLGVSFSSSSDTEVLLAAIDEWGVEQALRKVDGMLAFCLLDKVNQIAYLARDRFGEKPLYWTISNRVLAFGSELKALKSVPGLSTSINRNAVNEFVRGSAVRAPATIYENISHVEPGTVLRIDLGDAKNGQTPVPRKVVYWDPVAEAVAARQSPFRGSATDSVDALEDVLTRSIKNRAIADVPIGAFLSGGIDSSVIVSLLQKSVGNTKTFTIGSPDLAMDESSEAREVAKHLQTDHTELLVTAQDALDVVPRLATMYDEPFADSSQIPTHLVSALARKHVTVALSGDAGDELFGGYNRYLAAGAFWGRIDKLPLGARRGLASAALRVRPGTYDSAGSLVQKLGVARGFKGGFGNRIHKAAKSIRCADADELYTQLTSHWEPNDVVVAPAAEHLRSAIPADFSVIERMMLADTVGYLPADILTKVDRASMAVALEARVPFLNPDIFRFAWSLPMERKVVPGKGKVILRELLSRHVPNSLFERPKMGFGIPIDIWLRGPLREWAGDLLSVGSLTNSGYFKPDVVQRRWTEHLSGDRNWQHELWDIIMFQAWHAEWLG